MKVFVRYSSVQLTKTFVVETFYHCSLLCYIDTYVKCLASVHVLC